MKLFEQAGYLATVSAEGALQVAVTKAADERFGLTIQLRRAAVSVASTIAEGCGGDGERDFARFLSIAAGSASEVEYQLLLARDLGYLPDELHRQLDAQNNQIKRMLNSLIRKLS